MKLPSPLQALGLALTVGISAGAICKCIMENERAERQKRVEVSCLPDRLEIMKGSHTYFVTRGTERIANVTLCYYPPKGEECIEALWDTQSNNFMLQEIWEGGITIPCHYENPSNPEIPLCNAAQKKLEDTCNELQCKAVREDWL